jgi:membrane-bound lytic murein transglycosylase A
MPLVLLLLLLISGCSTSPSKKSKPIPLGTTHLQPVTFADLSGWDLDHHEEALASFAKSCNKILKKKNQDKKLGSNLDPWKKVCRIALTIPSHGKGTNLKKARNISRNFFEQYFQPYLLGASNHGRNFTNQALVTGYYEIELQGSLKPSPHCPHPILLPPKNLKKNHGSHHLKRSEIHKGSLKGKGLEFAWVKDLPRLYFMQIQGTGVVKLQEGGEMGLVWAGQNGFKFKGLPEKYRGSTLELMHQLRMEPDQGKGIMECNESYIFFQPRKEQHPVGSSNVILTPERSLALDSAIYPYGVPFWLDIKLPRIRGYSKETAYKRLIIGQDRGGAIKGGARFDLFLGRGRRAENLASGLRSDGRAFVLFPKEIKIPRTFERP